MNRLAWVVAAGVVVVGAGFAVVTVAGADSGGHYRVASVVTGDVAQTVSVSGTVDHVNRADVSFGTDGTVAELSVGVGDTVSAGQSLGSLDTASLQAAVDKADSDLDTAETNLSSASTAAESAVSSSSSSSSDSSASSRGGSDSAAAGLVQEVKDAQTAASAALTTASDAMAAQTTACADPTAAACTSAGAATLTAQQAVKAAQDTLQGKLDALSTALASAEQASASASASAQSSDSSDSSDSRSDSQAGPSGDSSASAGSVADAQAAVDQAKVKLLQAQQALAGATLTSPISGTVASVPVAVGAQASSGEAVVVVVGEGAAEVSATVTVEQLAKLATGQQATVTPVGTSTKVAGTVTRVSTLPDTSAQTVAYPVTITVDKPPASMASGSSATASIVVATAKKVLTVPTSAVNRNTVTVLNGDLTTVTRVTVGAVGPTRTEIKDGLSAGQQVVLANLDSPLPTSDTTNQGGFTNRERFGGAGGGPGGGGGAGGGPGGGGNVVVRPGN
jgi:multidrug efflux pump subunit AcrA (membrane-fusion protein)